MTARFHSQPAARGQGMTSLRARDRMIERLRTEGGISDERVLTAMRTVPRHLFIDEALASRAYEDTALPIGNGQTISQPWVVARMTAALIEHGIPQRVLEVGTGSGYQASVLATLGLETYSVERIEELLRVARRRFRSLGLNVRSRHDDGRAGWPEYAPFDGIIVTAGAAALEASLYEQLPEGGTLIAPIGAANGQRLLRLRRIEGELVREDLGAVVFVPLLPGTL
ncbi:MAG: protein-L-isoaspartate(D-aspartate) O-methyltransferase [Arenimonas sp.]|uniref:protein-L-isoaspartate(D-aspartate) O-methyltransferase n=1 Tax=Arenimonas sp. TaxID=1872635 RepID=UPI0025C27866|nr:protein-L-isoaspartate(D-aspartate) O-methyltransferase [Arenimonas sp.]MBW8367218.1 protein-L-isoaspartate(D-aspartate) O-methyltransferase [Arenimonas sp.]